MQTPGDLSKAGDKELALWMLDRIADSGEFLAVIRNARVKGRRDVLDTPDYVEKHKARRRKLFEGDDEETVTVPVELAAEIEALIGRDLLSGKEELIEKALTAFIVRHPERAAGAEAQWLPTVEAARAEVEGRTKGQFRKGLVKDLAAAARAELARQAEEQARDNAGKDRGGHDR